MLYIAIAAMGILPLIFAILLRSYYGAAAILLAEAILAYKIASAKTEVARTYASKYFVTFAGIGFSFEDTMRHWICVGKSGCGKTIGFIKSFVIQITENTPKHFNGRFWGGVMTDDKGDFAELAEGIFRKTKFGTGTAHDRLRILRAAQPNNKNFKPKFTINLIGNKNISWKTYAQLILDVAISQGQKTSNAHFKSLARGYIADIFETLDICGHTPTLALAYEFIVMEDVQADIIDSLPGIKSDAARRLYDSWSAYQTIDVGEKSGLKSTIGNYLRPYTTPEITEIFCADKPTVKFECIDNGYVLIPSVPQAHLTERGYITAFFKMLLFLHGLMRFDKGSEYIKKSIPLFLIADEAQSSLIANEEGLADNKALDRLRAAKCCIVMAMQDYVSAEPVLETVAKTRVLFANLNNHVIFSLNTPEGRKMASDNFGEKWVNVPSYSWDHKGNKSKSVRKERRHIYSPEVFNAENMANFRCIVSHCQGAHVKSLLPPIDDSGKTEGWFKK
jgi:hypothetical protein